MNTISTQLRSCISIAILILSFTTLSQAQTSPNMKFVRPVLSSGTAGQEGATYKFSNVIAGVNALVKIKKKNNNATLVNIDDTTTGYYNSWQPVVGGPELAGQSSSIEWDISFVDAADGKKHKFANFDISALDIDGDNVRIREFIDVNGEDSWNVPTAVPTLLNIGTQANPDPESGDNGNNTHGLGPVITRNGIDTTALNCRVNLKFSNKDKIKFWTGATVQTTPSSLLASTPETATSVGGDRYYSIYFKPVSNVIVSILPITLRTFDAVAVNNNAANLYWITGTEMMNDHFEVERSFDQKNFKSIGIVLGAQTMTTSASQYSFKDASADLSGHSVIYYRLRQVDMDDNFTYSPIKTVRMSSDAKTFVQVYPNPYMEKLNINFVSDAAGKALVRLTNTQGQIASSKENVISKGYNNFQMENLNIAPGIYVADLVINGKTIATQKVVKL